MFLKQFIKKKRKLIIQEIVENFGKPVLKNRVINSINAYYRINANSDDSIDAKTWDDLEMDEIFNFIDRTSSKTGEQFLFNQLRKKQSEEEFNRFNSKVNFYLDNFENLISNTILLQKYNNISSYNLPLLLDEKQSSSIPKWTIGLGILSLCLGFFCIFFSFLLLPFIFIGIINTLLHYYYKKHINFHFYNFQNIKSLRDYYTRLLKNDNEDNFLSDKEMGILNIITKKCFFLSLNIEVADEFSAALFYLIEIIKGFFLADAIQFNSVIKLINKNSNTLLKVYCFIGIVDSSISIASVKKGTEGCEPSFVHDKKIKIINAYHPLIDNCIKNSISLIKQNAIITGGNMSGKTSFLKTVGINIHLSQTINYSFSNKMEIPRLSIFSSIENEDNLEQGISFFMDELLRTKEIIDKVNMTHEIHLILIDEIYKGTNSKDRISLASSVLNHLSKGNCIVFVTTHDLDIIDFVQKNYLTFYFGNSFEENMIVFDFKIQKGIQNRTNVIELIKALTFPTDVITNTITYGNKLRHAHNSK